jgi:hypothetical protein
MEKLYTFGRRLLAWFSFFISWYFCIAMLDHRYDRGFYAFWVIVAAAVGVFFLYLDWRSLRRAEQAAHTRRQLDVLRLAEAEGGQLTPTRTAARLGWPMRDVLATLRSLEDGVRVTTYVPEEGVTLYEFPEIIHESARHDRVRVP